jgi:hypothetical protein
MRERERRRRRKHSRNAWLTGLYPEIMDPF